MFSPHLANNARRTPLAIALCCVALSTAAPATTVPALRLGSGGEESKQTLDAFQAGQREAEERREQRNAGKTGKKGEGGRGVRYVMICYGLVHNV